VGKRRTQKPPAPPAAEATNAPKNVTADGRFSADRDEDTERLSPLENRFVLLVAEGSTTDEAATTLGKSARTLRRWKRRPDIAEAIRARSDEQMTIARAVLSSGAVRAARELSRLAEKATPDHARVSACRVILERATEQAEIAELEVKLAELEQKLGPRKGGTF
jgi:hypothetical protein